MTTTAPATPTATAPSPAAASSRTASIVALALGGASIIFGQTFLLPIAAIVVGVIGYRNEPSGRSFAVWGIVLGALAIFGWLLVAIAGFAFLAPWLLFAL